MLAHFKSLGHNFNFKIKVKAIETVQTKLASVLFNYHIFYFQGLGGFKDNRRSYTEIPQIVSANNKRN